MSSSPRSEVVSAPGLCSRASPSSPGTVARGLLPTTKQRVVEAIAREILKLHLAFSSTRLNEIRATPRLCPENVSAKGLARSSGITTSERCSHPSGSVCAGQRPTCQKPASGDEQQSPSHRESRGRRFKSCPRYKVKHQVRGRFRSHPEAASGRLRSYLSAICRQKRCMWGPNFSSGISSNQVVSPRRRPWRAAAETK
jgi:hypothetical protein